MYLLKITQMLLMAFHFTTAEGRPLDDATGPFTLAPAYNLFLSYYLGGRK